MESPSKRILVTGGAGYLGSQVVRNLLEQGYAVTVLDAFLYGDESLADVQDAINIIRGDTRDPHSVYTALEGIDAVVHLGEVVGEPAFVCAPNSSHEINYEASYRLAAAAKERGVIRFLYTSSCSVYGFSAENTVFTETSSLNPVGLYGHMKVATEQKVLELADDTFQPVILRLGTLYGLSPRPRFDLVINTMTVSAVTQGRIHVQGPDNWRPHVNVRDAAKAITLALDASEFAVAGQIFNVGDDRQNMSMRQTGQTICSAIGNTELDIEPAALTERRSYSVSFRKIREVLGFTADYEIADSVREMADFIRKTGDVKDSRFSNVARVRERDIQSSRYLV